MKKTLILKISRLVLLSSLIINLLSVNGYSSIILTQVCQSVQNNIVVFQINNKKIILAQTVKKNVENMVEATKNMLTVVGFVDSLFQEEAPSTTGEKENSISVDNTITSAVVSLVDNIYVFSFESAKGIVEQKLTKSFLGNKIEKIISASSDLIASDLMLLSLSNVYENIQLMFINQNVGNHSKIYLNIDGENTFLKSEN